MTNAGGDRWCALPVEIAADELASWRSAIRQPIAVTGGSGFLGSHTLAALFAAGVRPRVLVRGPSHLADGQESTSDVVRGDLDNPDALAGLVAGCGTVIHLAGLVRAENAARFDRVNRTGSENVVAALARVAPAARLVHVSSLAAVGPSREPAGSAPEDQPHPISAYGRSKLAGEMAARTHTGPWVIVRPPAVYGPRDIDVLHFFRMAARGLVPIPGGEHWASVAFVADVVRAILAAATGRADGCVLHLGAPEPMTMEQLVRGLAESGGVRAKIVPVPGVLVRVLGHGGDLLQALGMHRIAMTSDKARELLARYWSTSSAGSLAVLGLPGFVPFPAGAAETWAWYRRHGWV